MALARTSRGSWDSGASHGTGSYTTGSFTPSANSLLTVIVCAETNNGSSNISASLTITDSAGLTWTAITNVGNSTSWATGMRAWRAPVGASPSSMTVTVDCGANNIYEYLVDAIDFTGYDTSSPIGATATGGGSGSNGLGADGAASITLSAAPASSSLVIGALGGDTSSAGGVTYGTGWTELYDVRGPGEAFLQVQERTGSTSTTVGWNDICTSGTAWKSLGLAFEVKAAASGSTGTLAATESGADTAALAGDVLIDGSLAATESGGDTAALAGDVLIAGTFAATESGADVAAIEGTAQQVSTGSLAATESGADTASIAGTVLVEGALAATESGSDTAAIAGDVPVSGTLAATESGTDTAALAGDVYISGALAATESGSDTAAIEGSLAVIATGSLAATESGSDTASIAGVVLVSGSLAATEAANDSAAMSGVVLITGTLDATESGQDTAAISSAPPVTTAYPGPAGKSRGKRRRVVIRERVYEVNERDIPALIEAELLDRAPPATAEHVAGPKPPRKRRRKAAEPVKTVEQVREVVQQIKARIEPDNAWLVQALEAVAFRVLERLQDEEDSLMLLLAA